MRALPPQLTLACHGKDDAAVMEQPAGDVRGDDVPPDTLTKEELDMSSMGHLLAIVLGFPAPLALWMANRRESAFVASHALEALNFKITTTTAMLVIIAIATYGFFAGRLWLMLSLLLLLPILVLEIVCGIVGSMRARAGRTYRYPLTLRLIR